MTLIFDVFVIYTLFNQINCGIIDDSFNRLHFLHWIICCAFAITTIFCNFIIKLIPLEKLIDKFTKDSEHLSAEKARTTINEMVKQDLKE